MLAQLHQNNGGHQAPEATLEAVSAVIGGGLPTGGQAGSSRTPAPNGRGQGRGGASRGRGRGRGAVASALPELVGVAKPAAKPAAAGRGAGGRGGRGRAGWGRGKAGEQASAAEEEEEAAPEPAARPSLRIHIPVADVPPLPAASPSHASRGKAKAKRSRANSRAAVAHAADGPAGEAPPAPTEPGCVFKGYSFTLDPPPEMTYDFGLVPHCKSDLSDSVLLRPSSRRQWFVCLKELESLAKESLDRRAARLELPPPSGLPLVYIADRMDIDDPLWGYQVRSASTGYLQGFITLTVFTTWTHFFEWDSLSEKSGMAAARVANSLAGRPDPALELLEEDSTVAQLASRVGARPAEIVHWNAARFPHINSTSRILSGTEVYVRDPAEVDTVQVTKKGGETVRAIAARLGLAPDDLVRLNGQKHPHLAPGTRLPKGTSLSSRDRVAEPEVFLPTGASRRALDEDGSLAADLQLQARYGDPITTGVVWPRVVEIGLLAGLGCGKVLVRLALEELAASGQFDFVVLQATMASVSFYEEMGFARVGAVARYASEGTPLAALPLHGYRHWASADEAQLEQFGDISYMMALRLSGVMPKGKARPSRALAKRLVSTWPEVRTGVPSTVDSLFLSGLGRVAGARPRGEARHQLVRGEGETFGDESF
jgi:hypothetical protein